MLQIARVRTCSIRTYTKNIQKYSLKHNLFGCESCWNNTNVLISRTRCYLII